MRIKGICQPSSRINAGKARPIRPANCAKMAPYQNLAIGLNCDRFHFTVRAGD